MKKTNMYFFVLATMALFTFGCTSTATDETTEEVAVIAEPDMAIIKGEIQEIENAWAKAQNEKDIEGLLAMYADDAVSMGNDEPSIMGKEDLRKSIEKSVAEAVEGRIISFETTNVFGSENQVTEVGITNVKDTAGMVVQTGKYMAVWEKRDGKYLCIRDIYNRDAPAKK